MQHKCIDPATHDVIMDCYAESEALYNTGVPADKKQAKLWVQCIEKSVYTLGMVMMEVSISENDADKILRLVQSCTKEIQSSRQRPSNTSIIHSNQK